jgi:uncharacterized membrane protein
MVAGAAIRQFFVMRHGYKLGHHGHPWPYALVGVAVIVGVVVWLKPAPTAQDTQAPEVGFSQVQAVLAQRCYMCHGAQVQMKNVRLDTAADAAAHAQNIYQQAVVSKIMPMNNATGMTEAERQLIKQWFEAGAKIE